MAYQDDIYRAAREGASGKTNRPIQTGGNFVPTGGGGTYGSDNSAFTVQRQGQVKRDRYRNAAMDAAEANMFARLPEVPPFGRNMRNALQRVSGAASSTAMAEQFEMNRRQQELREQEAAYQQQMDQRRFRAGERQQDWRERTDARDFQRGVQTGERAWEEATRRYNEGRMDAKEQQAYERQRDERGFQRGVEVQDRAWEEATRRYQEGRMDQQEQRDYERQRDERGFQYGVYRDAQGDQRYANNEQRLERAAQMDQIETYGKVVKQAEDQLNKMQGRDLNDQEKIEYARLMEQRSQAGNAMQAMIRQVEQQASSAPPSPQAAQGGGYYQPSQPQNQLPVYGGQSQAPQYGGGNYAPQQGGQYAQPAPQQGGYPQQPQPDWRLSIAPGGQQAQAPQQTQDPRMALRGIETRLDSMRGRETGTVEIGERKQLEQQREALFDQLDPRDRGAAITTLQRQIDGYLSRGAKGKDQVADMKRLVALRDRYKAEMADPSLARRQPQPLQPLQQPTQQAPQPMVGPQQTPAQLGMQTPFGQWQQEMARNPYASQPGAQPPPQQQAPVQQQSAPQMQPQPQVAGGAITGEVLFQGRRDADTLRPMIQRLPPNAPERIAFEQADRALNASGASDADKAAAAQLMAQAAAGIQGGGQARVAQPEDTRHWTEKLEDAVPRLLGAANPRAAVDIGRRAAPGILAAYPSKAELRDINQRDGGWMSWIGQQMIGSPWPKANAQPRPQMPSAPNPNRPNINDSLRNTTLSPSGMDPQTRQELDSLYALVSLPSVLPNVKQAALQRIALLTGQQP